MAEWDDERGGGVVNSSRRDDTPVLITEAQPSYDDQQASRRRKYAIMMSMRIPCLIIAAGLYGVWHIWWLALIVLAVSVPLPWMAVLIANDRPARKDEHVHRYRRPSRELESRTYQVIDDEDRSSEDQAQGDQAQEDRAPADRVRKGQADPYARTRGGTE